MYFLKKIYIFFLLYFLCAVQYLFINLLLADVVRSTRKKVIQQSVTERN